MPSGFGHAPFGHYPFGHAGSLAEIRDIAWNPLASGSTGQMLGYVEPPAEDAALDLDIYRFILNGIRIEDQKDILFLKRYLEGPQSIWNRIQETIFSIKDLWSAADCPDEYLRYLKNIVGWTVELEPITDELDDDTLRRLIAVSWAIWKERGSEDAMINVLELLMTSRLRLWNWFDYRWVLGETELSEELEGRDPWMIDLPVDGGSDEYFSNLRIVDDGSLNRTLVRNIVKLMRPVGERYEISYITFLDLFRIADSSQWMIPEGTLTIAGGNAKLTDDSIQESMYATIAASALWEDYVASWRIKGTSTTGADFYGVSFYVQDEDNGYAVALNTVAQTVTLYRVNSGVYTSLVSTSYLLFDDVYKTIRVQVSPEGITNRIKVYVDGNLKIDTTNDEYTEGRVGMFHAPGATIQTDEVEMFQLPLTTELVGINP
jgi:hypothetical protein